MALIKSFRRDQKEIMTVYFLKKFFTFWICFFVSISFFATDVLAKKESKKSSLQIKKAWSKSLKPGKSKKRYYPEAAGPVVSGSRIFVGTHAGLFYALEKNKGKIVWQTKLKGPIASPATVKNGVVYVGDTEGYLSALRASDGKLLWQTYLFEELLAAPIIWDGKLVLLNAEANLFVVALESGKILKRKSFGYFKKGFSRRQQAPLTLDQNMLYLAFYNSEVLAFDLENFTTIWQKRFEKGKARFDDFDSAAIIDGDFLYVAGYPQTVAKLNKKTGRVVWQKNQVVGVRGFLSSNKFIVVNENSEVLAYQKQNGLLFWKAKLECEIPTNPVELAGNLLWVACLDEKEAFILNGQSGKILRRIKLSETYLGTPVLDQNNLYFLDGRARLVNYRFFQ